MSETVSIEDRLNFLEEQNDGLKRAGLLLVVLVLFMGATMIYQSSNSKKAIYSDGVILNDSGKPRAALTPLGTGHIGMLFYDFAGNIPQQVSFEAVPSLDGLVIYDRTGHPRILLGLDDQDNPIFDIISPQGQTVFSALPTAPPSTPDATPGANTPLGSPTPTPSK